MSVAKWLKKKAAASYSHSYAISIATPFQCCCVDLAQCCCVDLAQCCCVDLGDYNKLCSFCFNGRFHEFCLFFENGKTEALNLSFA